MSTPMTELLQWLGHKELSPLADEIRRRFLEREKEFAEKCFDAGIDFSEGVDQPNKTQFIDKLYNQ